MKKVLFGAGALLLAAGAGYYLLKSGTPGGGALSVSSAVGPLDYVPAETAFVVANVEPMPKAVTQAWMEQFAQISGIYAMQAKLIEKKLAEEDPQSKGLQWVRALAAEVKDRTPEQMLDELGIDLQLRYAFYEVSGKPVLRLELADPARTRAFVARVEQKAGERIPTAKVDALEYWNFADDAGKARAAVAIDGSHLVLAVVAADADDGALRMALGLSRPAQSLAASGRLSEINKEFGYTPYASGYVDTRKVIALVDAAVPAPDAPDAGLKAVCAKDYDAIAQAVPRVVFGYTRFEARAMHAQMLVELRDDIAKELQPLPAPMPGMGATAGSAFDFGFAMDLEALAGFVNKRADAVLAAPFACPALLDLNDGAKKAKEQFSNPMLYATAAAFHSIHVIATRFAMPQAGGEGATQEPEFAGKLLIGSRSPAGLMGMLAGFAPQIASLQLKPDGVLKEIPSDQAMPLKGPMHAVMSDSAIGVSIGEGESATLKDALASDAANKALFVFGYGGAFFKTIFASAAADLAKSDDPEAEQVRQTMETLQKLYAEKIERIDMQMRAGERGIEFVQDVRLK